MAKKTKNGDQPEVVAEAGTQEEGRQEQAQEKKSAGIVTTEGNTVDRIRIFQKDGATMVQADYGKLKDGKTAEDRRANMRTQISRALSPEQAKEYQRLYAEDPGKAKEYAVRQAYPMHVDDAAFHNREADINGRKVNYINLEKITEGTLLLNALRKDGVDVDHMDRAGRDAAVAAMTPEAKAAALKGQEGLIGRWQLSFGEKGNKDSRFYGILNKEDLASIRHRAEVTLDDKGQVKTIGKPMAMTDIAARFEQRVTALRQTNEAKVESAQKVDWSKFKFPEGAVVTGLRYAPAKDNPDRVWLNGKVNGIEVFGLLSKNETTAVRNKLATLEQAGAANKEFRDKVKAIVAPAQTVTMADAVKAVVDRASDSTAKAFTPDQLKTLNGFAASAETPEERQKLFDGVWAQAQPKLAAANVNEAWQKDAHDELNDLAEGAVREEQQGLKR